MESQTLQMLLSVNAILLGFAIYAIKRFIQKIDNSAKNMEDKVNKINISLAKMTQSEQYTILQIKNLEKKEEKLVMKIEEIMHELSECSHRICSIETAIANH